MVVREFLNILSDFTRSNADVDVRFRGLRKEGFLPGARGRHAPQITPEQAATIVLALVASRAVEGAEVGLRLARLPAVAENGLEDPTLPTLIEYLFPLLGKPGLASKRRISHIEASENPAYARVIFTSGRTMLFSDDAATLAAIRDKPEVYDFAQSGLFRRLTVFSASLLEQLAVQIKVN